MPRHAFVRMGPRAHITMKTVPSDLILSNFRILLYFYVLFLFLFQSILKSEHSDKLEERLVTLKYHLTKSVFHNVCRSIFERDKLVFAFSLVLGILRSNVSIFSVRSKINQIHKKDYHLISHRFLEIFKI